MRPAMQWFLLLLWQTESFTLAHTTMLCMPECQDWRQASGVQYRRTGLVIAGADERSSVCRI